MFCSLPAVSTRSSHESTESYINLQPKVTLFLYIWVISGYRHAQTLTWLCILLCGNCWYWGVVATRNSKLLFLLLNQVYFRCQWSGLGYVSWSCSPGAYRFATTELTYGHLLFMKDIVENNYSSFYFSFTIGHDVQNIYCLTSWEYWS